MIKIALTNLGKYNEGVLDYTWLTLPATDEEIAAAMDEIQVSHGDTHYFSDGLGHVATNDYYGEYEEYFITDYECDFMSIGEYTNLDELNETAEKINDLDEWRQDIVKALIDEGYDLDQAIDECDNVVVYGDCKNMTDVAYYMIDETCAFDGVPDWITNYFDYESYGRDLSFDGHWFTVGGDMAVLYY